MTIIRQISKKKLLNYIAVSFVSSEYGLKDLYENYGLNYMHLPHSQQIEKVQNLLGTPKFKSGIIYSCIHSEYFKRDLIDDFNLTEIVKLTDSELYKYIINCL